MFDQHRFCERLNLLRLHENKTLEEIAALLGISTKQVESLESGETNVTLEQLVALSEYFQVSTDFLLGMTDLPFLKSGAAD